MKAIKIETMEIWRNTYKEKHLQNDFIYIATINQLQKIFLQ